MQFHSKKFRSVLIGSKDLIMEAITKTIVVTNWKTSALNLLTNLVANEMGKPDAVFVGMAVEVIQLLTALAVNTCSSPHNSLFDYFCQVA